MKTPEWFKPALFGVAVGAVAAAIVGFSVGGWVTAGGAERLAAARGDAAAVKALVPHCLALSENDPQSAAIMAQLKDARSYERDNIVADAGWATQPGAERPDQQVAAECAERLTSAL